MYMIIVITYPIVYRSTYICATHVYISVYVHGMYIM